MMNAPQKRLKRRLPVLMLLACLTFSLSSCLKNLNESEYFRKLEIKAPDQYKIVSAHKGEIEDQVEQALKDAVGKELTEVTHWGAGRYACGPAVSKNMEGKLTTQGTYRYDGMEKLQVGYYGLIYEVSEEGKINILVLDHD